MPFPIIALLTAAASDAQQRSQHGNQIMQAGQAAQDRINRARVQQLGGQPYGLMAEDFRTQLGMMDRNAEQSRNNNIGALLQAYLTQKPETKAGNPDAPLASGWQNDPWGDAGY